LSKSEDANLLPEELASKYTKAYNYLHQFETKIENDGKCLFLLFKCWWVMNTKSFPLADEKQALPLDGAQWDYCLTLSNKILYSEGWNNIAVILFTKALAEFHLKLLPGYEYNI
jgi:hypothetical protein